MTEHEGLPVAGYRPQSVRDVTIVNGFKQDEERTIRVLEARMKAYNDAGNRDGGRWCGIAITELQKAYHCVNRAIFLPSRIALPEDEGASTE